MKNIFAFGLNAFNRSKLEALDDADRYRFHGLLDLEELKDAASYDFHALLNAARERLARFEGTVDAIINFWDFPASVLHPILCREHGLPGPSLESVIRCGNKGISRLAQQEVIPEYIPRFSIFDPFDDHPLEEIEIDYPFWIKPLVSYSSYLGFHINDQADFLEHIQTIRENIGRYAEPYDQLLNHVDLDGTLRRYTAYHCIAEEIISSGVQCTVEGYSHRDRVECYGIVDSIRYPNRVSFSRYQYPSVLPEPVKQRIHEVSKTFVEHIGYDGAAFDIEFFYDEATDGLRLLEINSRISQSHADLFEKVDGTSNHRVVVDLGLGEKPRFPSRRGDYRYAAKIFARRFDDAIVRRAPTVKDIEAAQRLVPGATIMVPVRQGERLSELLDQDSYSFQYAIVYLGARNSREMARAYKRLMKALPFEFEPVAESAAAP